MPKNASIIHQRNDLEERADLRTLAWRLLGLSFLIQHQDHDAVANEDEQAGIGLLVQDIGEELLAHVREKEDQHIRRGKRSARSKA